MNPTTQGPEPSKITRADRSRALKLLRHADSVERLVDAVAKSRGRPIELLPWTADSGGMTAVLIATTAADYIAYDSQASSAFRSAIICHELAHMLLGHDAEADPRELTTMMAPDIDPLIARRFLARHGYDSRVEADAESLGTFMSTELSRNADRLDARQDAVSQRLR